MLLRPLSTLFTKQAKVLFHCSTTMSQQPRLNVSLKLMMWEGRGREEGEEVQGIIRLVCFAFTPCNTIETATKEGSVQQNVQYVAQ